MKISELPFKVKTRENKKTPNRKVYNYIIKNVGSIRFNDLVDLMGIDIACTFLDIFGGASIYIPKKSSLKKDFLHTIISAEAQELYKKEKNICTIIAGELSKKYSLHIASIHKILGLKNIDAIEKEKFKKKVQIDYIRDEALLTILKNNWDLIQSHDLI